MARRVTVQSVLYANSPRDVRRAAEAAFNTLERATAAGVIDGWDYRLGDCAPTPTLSDDTVAAISADAEAAGGRSDVEYFGANLGSAAGHNRLAAKSTADVLLFLNPDAQMAPDTVELLVRALRPDVGVVEARQVPLDHPKEYAPTTGDTSWASTACAVTPRELFERVGGFDAATFFLYGDDVDYSWRVRLEGLRVLFEPAAAVFHDKRLLIDSGWPVSPAEQYYSAEASLLIAHKYSNPERVEHLLSLFESSDAEFLQRAWRAFEARRAAGELPEPIDPQHTVARFIGDHYAQHRF
ncbi:glycosyltransferase [Microbacterium sp. Bi128]|uniref:glycosyltransferase n=1 Tax=Microbacterium sp. Bi128 TaxID=2821115 RepID=UPI001DC84BE7|nr:glycosyltransferase [Microbacterium sp. Bi128]CAH0131426.1 hypothetical protein SRABI128_00083 [Microbacterium sp. Bi128]